MTEPGAIGDGGGADVPRRDGRVTAGSLLREARQRQGLHIGVLAAGLKVPQHKLEALEGDRLDQLPDATFTRALAQSVCRVLKIDAGPVLAQLPHPAPHALERVDGGLNTPFRERPGRVEPSDHEIWRQPVVWIVVLLLAAAAAVWTWPQRGAWTVTTPTSGDTAAPSAQATPAARTAAPNEPASAISAAAPAAMPAASTSPAPPVAGAPMLVFRATAAAWVEVADNEGRVLLSRELKPSESATVQGTPPLKLRIGNVAGTQVEYRGQPVDLSASARDNVARIELD